MARDPGTGARYKPPPRSKPAIHDLIVAPQGDHAAQRPVQKPRRPATPIVTEHIHGQAHAGPDTRTPRDYLPTDYGSSLHPPRSTASQRSAYRGGHIDPFGSAGTAADMLLRLLGSTDRAQYQRADRPNQQSAFAPAELAAGEIGKSFKQDVTHPLRNPLNTALDALSVASLGAGAAGKVVQVTRAARVAEEGDRTAAALRALHAPLEPAQVLPKRLLPDESGLRKIRVEGGEVQVPNQSRNLLTAAGQHGLDRLSEKIPDVAGIGAKTRAARHLTAENQVRATRLTAQAMPLEEAARKLRSVRGVTPREMAYTVVADYGHTGKEGARLLDQEIALRQSQLAGATGKAQARLADRVKLLQAAREHVLNPDAELQTAVAEGKKLSDTITESRVGRGAMTAETAGASPARHIRITHGAMFEKPTPGKLGIPAKVRKDERARVESLQRRYDAAVAKESKSLLRGRTPEQAQARLAELDKWYQERVDKVSERVDPYLSQRSEQGRRNKLSYTGKNRGNNRLPTVKNEVRALAEQKIAALAAKHPEQSFAKKIAERESLQSALHRANEKGGVFEGMTNGGSLGKLTPEEVTRLKSPTVLRLGGALSVSKDRLARIDKAAAARVKPTGLLGAENVKPGPLAFYNPDVEKPTRGAAISARSPVSLNPPREKIHQSEGILFRQARNRVGPETTLGAFKQEIRHLDRTARADRALGFSKPYNPDVFNPREHTLIDPNAAKSGRELPRGTKSKAAAEKRAAAAEPQEVDLATLSPKEAVQRYIDEHTAWHQKLFPTAANVNEEHRTGLRMVDKKIADAISGADVVQRMQSGLLGKAFDFTNDLNRLGLIYANPVSYALVQGTGNALFLGLHQGIFTPTNVAKYGRVMTRLDRETRRRIDLSVGGGPARHLAHERGHAVSLQGLANFDNMLADLMPRRLAWLEEAHKKGYNTPTEIKALLTDPKLEQHLNVVEDRSQQAMVKFRRNPTRARQMIGRAIFIAPWLEGSTRYLGRLALDRPVTARVANEIRDRISQKQVDAFGKVGREATGGFVPVGKAFKKAGIPVVPGMNPDSLSPVGSGIGVLKTIGEVAGLTGAPLHGGSRLMASLQPSVAAGLAALQRRDAYSGYNYPANRSMLSIFKEQEVGSLAHPALPIVGTIATAFRKPTPPTGKEHYVPEAGPLDALKRAAFGSARERLVEQPYVQAQTRKIDRSTMSPVQKAQADGRDLLNTLTVGAQHHGILKPGQQLAPILRNAVKARTRRHAYYAQVGAKTQPDLFKADIALLLKSKVIGPSQAQAGLDWLAKGPSKRAIEHQRDLLDPAFYTENGMSYTQIIAAARKEIHQAQDAGH